MTRQDHQPGRGPAAGITYAVLIGGALIVLCGVVVTVARSLS